MPDVIENNTLSNRQHLIAKSTRTILLTESLPHEANCNMYVCFTN